MIYERIAVWRSWTSLLSLLRGAPKSLRFAFLHFNWSPYPVLNSVTSSSAQLGSAISEPQRCAKTICSARCERYIHLPECSRLSAQSCQGHRVHWNLTRHGIGLCHSRQAVISALSGCKFPPQRLWRHEWEWRSNGGASSDNCTRWRPGSKLDMWRAGRRCWTFRKRSRGRPRTRKELERLSSGIWPVWKHNAKDQNRLDWQVMTWAD